MAATLLTALVVVGIAAPAAGAQPASVLVVGDSLEELTSPYLGHFLPGVPITVNAVGGSNSFQILDLFQESYEPVRLGGRLRRGDQRRPRISADLAGKPGRRSPRPSGEPCIVVPTIHGFTVNGVDNAGKNRVVAEFAASRPGTQTPDWAGFVHAHPQLMQSDGLHPIEAGAQARAEADRPGHPRLSWGRRRHVELVPRRSAAGAPRRAAAGAGRRDAGPPERTARSDRHGTGPPVADRDGRWRPDPVAVSAVSRE